MTNDQGTTIVICAPVYTKATGKAGLAKANAAATTEVTGLVSDTNIANAANGNIMIDGILTATTGQWDAVTGGANGLTIGAIYYLSDANAGILTPTAPNAANSYIVRVGRALSAVKMDITVTPPIRL
jgi:hypothetical protein